MIGCVIVLCVCVNHVYFSDIILTVSCVKRIARSCSVLTEVGVLGGDVGATRLRRFSRVRTLNLRKDSRLRLARLRNEAVRLNPPPSSPPPDRSMLVETNVSAPWRERRTLPTQSVTWACATVSLSPR